MAVPKFLEQKWRKGFRFYDINKDGVVSKEDFLLLAAYIGERSGATAEEKVKINGEFMKWLERLSPLGQKLTEDIWVQSCVEIHKDLKNQERITRQTFTLIFDILDLNKDGLISYDELRIYYEGLGCKDESFIRKVFHQLDINKDGYIEREELITAGVSYWVSEDENDKYSFMYDPAGM